MVLFGQCPQRRHVVWIPVQQLDEIEDVAPLVTAEATEALGLFFARKDSEAGRVLPVEGAQRERPAAELFTQCDTPILEHPSDRHGFPELLRDLCKGRIGHHMDTCVRGRELYVTMLLILRHNATHRGPERAAPCICC
jgi:hypothetical protein